MLDVQYLVAHYESVVEDLRLRGYNDRSALDRIRTLYRRQKHLKGELQELFTLRKKLATAFVGAGVHQDERERRREEAKQVGVDVLALKKELQEVSDQMEALLSLVPNLPLVPQEDQYHNKAMACPIPVGHDEASNQEIERVGVPKKSAFVPRAHEVLGQRLGIMDFEQTTRMCGTRFVSLKGQGALLERALIGFMLDHTIAAGYQEISTPCMVRNRAMYYTGQLPKFASEAYAVGAEHYLIPTSEVTLMNLLEGKIFVQDGLPIRYTACTPCFRLEAGASGRDTHGMIRLHQFTKVEIVGAVTAESSQREHERMASCIRDLLVKLELPFRTVLLSTGDMGFAAARTYDFEVWMPSQQCYREISSCSNCTDFQSRRMKARYRTTDGTMFLHTLNGTCVAVGRAMAAILENYQNADGTVAIPSVLRRYMQDQVLIRENLG